ncbi:fungal-specific transcription factor domain-containing protein [Halenospora varia]|nr:fungal-specific transcription factor domain-containing protein [Halenospora varia]
MNLHPSHQHSSQSQSQLHFSQAQRQTGEQLEFASYYSTPSAAILQRDPRFEQSQLRGLEYAAASPSRVSIKTENPVHGFQAYATTSATTMPGSSKRSASGEPSTASVKQPRAEHPEEFSNAVKKKLQSSTRTGQACDRCKVRKIRCDGLAGGCSPCLQNNTECRTTDRITGRATQRGYVEGVESENRALQQKVLELEKKLRQHGINVEGSTQYNDTPSINFNNNPSSSGVASTWSPSPSAYKMELTTAETHEAETFRCLPTFRAGCTGDNYLGVSAGNANLSSIKGTVLSILGMEIDIADFKCEDLDEPDPSRPQAPLYNKSYQAFLQTTLNVNPKIPRPDLPSKEEAFQFSDWYFRMINPYMPLLHRPSFEKLLLRFFDDADFIPTASEEVIVRMVIAIMLFQYSTRNRENANYEEFTRQSNLHYHYSLGMYYQLVAGHTVQDVQALAIICCHLRNFPKPGASWILTQTAMSLAIELGLHRSAKRWAPDTTENPLAIEMRKRIFYTLLICHVTLSGKLGRPMALRPEDFDVELPEEIDDEFLSENSIDTSRTGRCIQLVGIHAIKLLPLFMEMYSTIYSVRRQPERYISTVNSLEAKIRSWRDNLPPHLVDWTRGHQQHEENQIFCLYTQIWELEFRLLLRHPSVSMTDDPHFNAENMRISVECSRKMLVVVSQLRIHRCLDTTWYNGAVYVMAITTTLFAQWDKRGETSSADLLALRGEMDTWLEIMLEVGCLLGSGSQLRDAVKVVSDGTLGLLERSLGRKNQKHDTVMKLSQSPPQASVPIQNNTYNYVKSTAANGNHSATPTYSAVNNQQTQQPQYSQYSNYANQVQSPTNITYRPQETPSFASYPSSTGATDPLTAFATQAAQTPQEIWQRRDSQIPYASSQAWRNWTNTVADTVESQDSYSAAALMQLGANGGGNVVHTSPPIQPGMTTNTGVVMDNGLGGNVAGHLNGGIPTHWPLNVLDNNVQGQMGL